MISSVRLFDGSSLETYLTGLETQRVTKEVTYKLKLKVRVGIN